MQYMEGFVVFLYYMRFNFNYMFFFSSFLVSFAIARPAIYLHIHRIDSNF